MTWEEIIKLGLEFTNEDKLTRFKQEVKIKEFPPIQKCVNMPKPILTICEPVGTEFYVDEKDGIVQCHWQHGQGFPEEKHGKSWYVDSHTIFFFERPFNNTPIETLKKLLPNHEIRFDNNDIMIDGKKVGPSMRTGWQKEKGHSTKYGDGRVEILEKSEPLTGRVYCLRWDDLEGLNKVFKDIWHHQDRLQNKAGLTTLAEYLEPKGITKNMFEAMLENDVIEPELADEQEQIKQWRSELSTLQNNEIHCIENADLNEQSEGVEDGSSASSSWL